MYQNQPKDEDPEGRPALQGASLGARLLDPNRVRADGIATMRRVHATVPDLARAWVYLLYLEDGRPMDDARERWLKIADVEKWIIEKADAGALPRYLEDGSPLPPPAMPLRQPASAVAVAEVRELAITLGLRWPRVDSKPGDGGRHV